MISEEAVEAAVRAYYERGGPFWADVDPSWRTEELADFRAALEAAAPHMRQAFFLEVNLRAVEDELNTPLRFGEATK